MKNIQKRALVWLLTLAMLIPMLSTAVLPAMAAITSGYIGNMDNSLTKGLIAPAEEAMINLDNNGGIRFATNINLEKYQALKQFCKQRRIKGLSVGTLIAPLDYIQETGEFSTMALGLYDKTYLDIKANTELFYDGEKTVAEGYDEQFVASIINIKLGNRARKFASIGYIQLTLVDGSHFTIYSYDNQNMDLVEKYATSLEEVATKALEKDNWSDEERAKIADLAAKETKLDINTETVKDVRTTRNQVFFTYVKGNTNFYNRLTYDGSNGWRLQTNTKNYNHFKDIGAGQSLALYMDEGFDDVTVPLKVEKRNDALVIKVEGVDEYATLSYNTFDLDFCNKDGVSLYNVNGMSAESNGDIKLTGKMNATEAVYGGGERFDDANKRGKEMNLYISDAYDASGSYVAIPLFSTSRGGGLFVNRYEPMSIAFPEKNTAGNWSLTISSETVDCYFYATGNISDVLEAYVDMTGHASLPEEWAQGYLVCRYAPDFNSLTDINGETEGVYWRETLPNPQNYTYTPHLPLTAEAAAKLKDKATIQDKTGKITYYIYYGGFFIDPKTGMNYTYAQLPNKAECYYDDPTKVSLADYPDALCHKKSITYGSN